MNKYLIGAILGITVLGLLSYQHSDNANLKWVDRIVTTILPLKQTDVIVTSNSKYVKKLLKRGYVVQDTDINHYNEIFYTLIKY